VKGRIGVDCSPPSFTSSGLLKDTLWINWVALHHGCRHQVVGSCGKTEHNKDRHDNQQSFLYGHLNLDPSQSMRDATLAEVCLLLNVGANSRY
jgi:hypothetical protein